MVAPKSEKKQKIYSNNANSRKVLIFTDVNQYNGNKVNSCKMIEVISCEKN